MDQKKKEGLSLGIGFTSLGALLISFSPEWLTTQFNAVTENKIAQAGFFFTMAAWIHAGRVKKEIASQFSIVTDAINNVASALRSDLAAHGQRLDHVTVRVESLEITVKERLNGPT